MKLSVKQLKQLVRESAEEMGLSSSNQDHHVDDLEQEMSTVDYSHDEEMEDMIDQHGHDADEADREAMAKQEEDDLMRTPEEGEDLSSRSGMGRRLAESLKLVVREAIEECGYEESLDEYGNPEEQALEEFLSEGKAKPKKKSQ